MSRLAQPLATCSTALDEAERLVTAREYGERLDDRLATAADVLDAADVVLLGLHPLRHPDEFAAVARLHRRLSLVPAAIPPAHRRRPALRRDSTSPDPAPPDRTACLPGP